MGPGGLPGGPWPYSTPGGGMFPGGPGSLFLLIKREVLINYSLRNKIFFNLMDLIDSLLVL